MVGESGSGKSLLSLAVMGLLPAAARVGAGTAWLDGTELLRSPEAQLRRLRGERVAMVFQDPLSSLNPVHRVGAQIAEAVSAHTAHRRPARGAWWSCCARSAFPTRPAAPTPSRTSCPAACGSGR